MQTPNRKYRRSAETNNHNQNGVIETWNVGMLEYWVFPHPSTIPFFHSSILLFSLFSFFFSLSSFSQVLNTSAAEISLPENIFNKAFIKKNKIKTITAGVVDKPDGEIIRDKGLAQVFLFDTNGNLSRIYYNEITSIQKTEIEIPATYKRGKLLKRGYTKIDYQYQYDTLGTEFFYTTNGFLSMKRTFTGDIYLTTYYEYSAEGWLKRQTKCRETNTAKHGEPFKLGMQTIISDEKFEYEKLGPTQVKKIFLNDEDKPYKTGIINYRENGLPADESYQFVVGFIRSSVVYKYDAAERLVEKIITDNSSPDKPVGKKFIYEYDEKGNLAKEKRFKNGAQSDEIIFLYDEAWKLTSQAERQFQKENIRIVKYEYGFY